MIEKNLENQANPVQKELSRLDQKIYEAELESLHELIKKVSNNLSFEPIYANAFGEEVFHYTQEEYFGNDNGGDLRGCLLHFSRGFHTETPNGEVRFGIEIFLLEDGSIRVFHHTSAFYNCETCEGFHSHAHRYPAENQSLRKFNINSIIRGIASKLTDRDSLVKEVSGKRIENPASLEQAIKENTMSKI